MDKRSTALNSQKLIQLRQSKGWNQGKLAEETGLAPRTIERAEIGHQVYWDTAGKIARALAVDLNEILLLDRLLDVDETERWGQSSPIDESSPVHTLLNRQGRNDFAQEADRRVMDITTSPIKHPGGPVGAFEIEPFFWLAQMLVAWTTSGMEIVYRELQNQLVKLSIQIDQGQLSSDGNSLRIYLGRLKNAIAERHGEFASETFLFGVMVAMLPHSFESTDAVRDGKATVEEIGLKLFGVEGLVITTTFLEKLPCQLSEFVEEVENLKESLQAILDKQYRGTGEKQGEFEDKSPADKFEFAVETLQDRQVVRGADLPLTIEGRYSSRHGEHVWVILQDSYGHYYLQNPAVQFLPSDRWVAMNVLPGEGIVFVHFAWVSEKGHAHFRQMAARNEWGAFSELPSDSTILYSINISRV